MQTIIFSVNGIRKSELLGGVKIVQLDLYSATYNESTYITIPDTDACKELTLGSAIKVTIDKV